MIGNLKSFSAAYGWCSSRCSRSAASAARSEKTEAEPPEALLTANRTIMTDTIMGPGSIGSKLHVFVAEQSELYKEQKDGDSAATVEGCLPPESTMPRERVVASLAALASLHDEVKATPAANQSNPRVMRVRNNPLFESLRGLDTVEGLAELRTVTDYILLPKLLVEALELEAAVVEARTQYLAARATYDFATATTPLPRLVDFLLRQEHEKLSEMLEATLAAYRAQARDLTINSTGDPMYFSSRSSSASGLTFRLQPHPVWATEGNDYRAVMDGLTGESLSEYGYEPGNRRTLAYATGCLLAGQPVPFSALPSSGGDSRLNEPHLLALRQGASGEVLRKFQERGVDFFTKPHEIMIPLAAQSGSRETLSWLHAQNPAAFVACGPVTFCICVKSGHIATARWLLDDFGIDLKREGQSTLNGCLQLCPAAAKRNDFDAVKWLHLELGYHMTTEVATHACKHGNNEMLKFCLERRGPYFSFDLSKAIRAALEGGHWDLAKRLLERLGKAKKIEGGRFLESACEGFKGDVEVLEALLAINSNSNELLPREMMHVAACHGYIEALEWAFTRLREECTRRNVHRGPSEDESEFLYSMQGAIYGNRADSARWLVEHALPSKRSAPKWGMRDLEAEDLFDLPSIELLEALLPCFDAKFFSSFYEQAVLAGNLDTLQWLGKHGAKIRPRVGFRLLRTLLEATGYAGEQAIPLIRCLREHCGLDIRAVEKMADGWTSDYEEDSSDDGEHEDIDRDHQIFYGEHRDAPFSAMAAASGDFARVEFVRWELDLPVGSKTIREAAERGHIPLCRKLQELLRPVYPWPQHVRYHAARAGANEAVAWAQEQDAKEEERKAKR